MNICIVQSSTTSLTETFIRAHIEFIPENVIPVQGQPPRAFDKNTLSNSLWARTIRVIRRHTEHITDSEIAYEHILRNFKADAVLAEYGMSGVEVMRVCKNLGIPLNVHFHGYDSCRRDVISKYGERYITLFDQAKSIIAVSHAMIEQLKSLGAPPENVFYNPYGVDCDAFEQTDPSTAPPIFLAVGRFVEKKAPHLLLLSFEHVLREHPDAQLRMIGTGPLLPVCRDLADALGIADSVKFLGPQPHHVVREEMLQARAFVQHSVVAEDGDSEGTPNSVLEAGAGGLPVIATFHAGIPDVVIHEETGLLVEERDVGAMARQMQRVLINPDLADKLGNAARRRVQVKFRMEQSIERLTQIIRSSVEGGNRPPLDHFAEERRTTRSVGDRV